MKTKKPKKINVLFWDDEAEGEKRMLFTEIRLRLEEYGWTPVIFTDREKALEAALKNDVDAVVLDLMEDGLRVGLDMLRYLRKQKPFLPIIMFTIRPEIEHIIDAMRGEASFYLISPIKNSFEIIQAVEIAIDREKAKESIINERYLASVGELAAGVAHFIKNSLYNIQSRAQLLLDQTNPKDEAYDYLEVINRRCSDANRVIVDLLNFAGGKKRKAEIKDVDIVKSIDNVLKLLSNDLKHKNIEAITNIKTEEKTIKGVEFDLKESFLNLIKNAIDAMPGGGKLSIDIDSLHDKLCIEISDTGIGMNRETLKNMFVPFYTTRVKSSGMGLFITHKIIRDHSGEISVKSKPGEGSTFTITLPKINKKGDA